jgi:hypothetical protein
MGMTITSVALKANDFKGFHSEHMKDALVLLDPDVGFASKGQR